MEGQSLKLQISTCSFFRHDIWRFAIFILKDALSAWTNLGKLLLVVWLCVPSIKMGARSIVRLDELPLVMHLERRTTEGYLSR